MSFIILMNYFNYISYMINIGDTVKRTAGTQHGMNVGDTDVVTYVGETAVTLRIYGKGHAKAKLTVINAAGNATATNTNVIKKLSNFYKKFTDAKTQSLVKAGYLNGDLEPTNKAHDKVKEIAFFESYDALVDAANEEIAEAEAEEAKNK
jgi:hypothetical protein